MCQEGHTLFASEPDSGDRPEEKGGAMQKSWTGAVEPDRAAQGRWDDPKMWGRRDEPPRDVDRRVIDMSRRKPMGDRVRVAIADLEAMID